MRITWCVQVDGLHGVSELIIKWLGVFDIRWIYFLVCFEINKGCLGVFETRTK
jgi:hypothetical protein